jgi:hypothetical protein
MTAVLPLTATFIIVHSYFAFTQRITLRTKGLSVGRISHNPPPSKCGLNDNATILKILIILGDILTTYITHMIISLKR